MEIDIDTIDHEDCIVPIDSFDEVEGDTVDLGGGVGDGKKEEGQCDKDRISELPEGILVSILSRLTIQAAARTSILSHKWEKLWTFTSSLNFDASETWDKLEKYSDYRWEFIERERLKYATWVNQVLKSHQAPTIEEFRICFDLTPSPTSSSSSVSPQYIDSWIVFAIKKRVQRLVLDLSSTRGSDQRPNERYNIPSHPFATSSSCNNNKSLKALRLKQVDISQELLDHILSTTPFLEHLRIKRCQSLVNLKVSGPSLNLNYLEVNRCLQLESIEISAIHLVSFKYIGRNVSLIYRNVPQLAQVSFRGHNGRPEIDVPRQLSGRLSQLKKLVLDLSNMCDIYLSQSQQFPKFPTMSNLRHLELVVSCDFEVDLSPIMSLIEASPFMHRFTLKLNLMNVRERKMPAVTRKHQHQCLKVVELLGFIGDKADVGIAMYLLENAVFLEKMIISPYKFEMSRLPSESLEREKRLTRECAMQLGTKLPPGAELLML